MTGKNKAATGAALKEDLITLLMQVLGKSLNLLCWCIDPYGGS